MSLQYPAEWKFDGIDVAIPQEADREFFQLIRKIAAGHSHPKSIFEAFKSAFGESSRRPVGQLGGKRLRCNHARCSWQCSAYVASFWEGIEAVLWSRRRRSLRRAYKQHS